MDAWRGYIFPRATESNPFIQTLLESLGKGSSDSSCSRRALLVQNHGIF